LSESDRSARVAPELTQAEARRLVQGPAIGLLITGILHCLVVLGVLLVFLMHG
jgi:hypothetical protein